MRPRFEIALRRGESDPLLLQVMEQLKAPDCLAQGRVRNQHVELTTCARASHVWSPRLSLHLQCAEDGTELLLGQFSPHPNVWTGFMALYGVFALCGVFGLVIGGSQWALNMSPWGLVAVPVALALIGFTYGASFIGQGLGAEEMYTLRAFVDDALRVVRKGASTR
jgi:hypothetical protein